uniref:Uncharacterized protein n=1 Tax=Anopheles maculatus TaxID=74869 RepID=A0A182T0M3_9DIPT
MHEDNEDEERQAGPAEDWDGGGLTFTAKSSPASPAISVKHTLASGGDRGASKTSTATSTTTTATTTTTNNNSSLIAHITSLPGFDPTKARIVKHYTSKFNSASDPSTSCPSGNPTHSQEPPSKANRNTLTLNTYNNNSNFSISSASDRERITPTAAESFLPWRRDRSYQTFGMCPGCAGAARATNHPTNQPPPPPPPNTTVFRFRKLAVSLAPAHSQFCHQLRCKVYIYRKLFCPPVLLAFCLICHFDQQPLFYVNGQESRRSKLERNYGYVAPLRIALRLVV